MKKVCIQWCSFTSYFPHVVYINM